MEENLNELKKEHSEIISTEDTMYTKIPAPYIFDSSLGGLEFRLLGLITFLSQPNGYASPNIDELRQWVGLSSIKPVIKALKDLEEGGYLISKVEDDRKIYVLVDVYKVYPFLSKKIGNDQ